MRDRGGNLETVAATPPHPDQTCLLGGVVLALGALVSVMHTAENLDVFKIRFAAFAKGFDVIVLELKS